MSPLRNAAILSLFILAALVPLASAFYLPGVAPRSALPAAAASNRTGWILNQYRRIAAQEDVDRNPR